MGDISDMENVEVVENEDNYKDRIPGSLSQIELSLEEQDYLLDYLDKTSPTVGVELLYAILGDKFLMYFDVLEGMNIKIPPRKTTIKNVGYIKIYTYLKHKGFTEEAYVKASKVFKKRVNSLYKIVEKVESKVNGGDNK